MRTSMGRVQLRQSKKITTRFRVAPRGFAAKRIPSIPAKNQPALVITVNHSTFRFVAPKALAEVEFRPHCPGRSLTQL